MNQEVEPSQRELDLSHGSIATQTATSEFTPINVSKLETTSRLDFDREWLQKYELNEFEMGELLARAKACVFSMGIGDAASQIGEVVSQFFAAKMFYVQKKLGLPCYASVIQPPDATIQSFHLKFLRCVPEAAKISWGQGRYGEAEFIPAEIDVDFCGMVVVGLNERLNGLELAENIVLMKNHLKILDRWPLDTNCIQPGNHFANIYQVCDNEQYDLPPFIGVGHLASDEYRNLMRDFVEKLAIRVETPFGVCLALVGEKAQKYWEIAQEGSWFAQKKRVAVAREIFKSDYILANDTHYELVSPTSCLVGCNAVRDENDYHLIVSNPTQEAYLVRGKKSLLPEVIQQVGIWPSDFIYTDLSQANILPHGSGHALVEDIKLKMVQFSHEGIFYVTELFGGGERIVKHYNAVPTVSRGSILSHVLKYGFIDENFATLRPLCSVKI